MWVAKSDIDYYRDRIADLEAQLKAEHEENLRAQRWLLNMGLRRLQTYPIPDKPKVADAQPDKPQLQPPANLGEAMALRDEGLRLSYTEADIDRILQSEAGMTLSELRQWELRV